MANNTLLASDNFASGSLAAGWSTWPNASGFPPQITAGAPFYAEAHAVGTAGGVIWTGLTWGNDQVSEFTIQSFSDVVHDIAHLFVRINAAGTAGYDAILINNGSGVTHAIITNYATGASISSAVNVTVNVGDVWTLQAAGCCITLYQNGSPVCFVADATFPTGGSPGFAVNVLAGGTLTSAQIASWRGYSIVQQDGIWQKQGVVIAPNSTDLASSGQGLFGGTFILDANPQLIAGTQVYKTWFSGGTPGSQGTYYAEAPALQGPWTRKAAQVISGYTGAMIIKVGSTYYSYSQLQNQAGSGNVALHTSSDGVNWALQSSNVLSPGAGGAWDASGFYPLRPITVINGTWYALITGTATGSGQFKIGLATSTDGAGAVWTKYSGNPTLSLPFASVFPLNTAWTLVNGKYYFWHSVGPSAAQQASGQDVTQLPSETARFSTPDFINWGGPIHSIHHSDQYEALNLPIAATPNNPGSGLNPCGMFTVGNKSYAIGQVEYLDGTSAGTQFALAIAPAPLSQVVLFNEDAVQQTATDPFTSGSGNLNSNWTNFATGWSTLQIVAGNLCQPANAGGAVNNGAVYTGSTFLTSQYAEITVHALTVSSAYAAPLVLGTASNGNCYTANVRGATGTQAYQTQLQRSIGGVFTGIGPIVGATINVGDVIRLSVVQSSVGPVLSLFQNGSLLIQYVDESSSALTTGNPGIFQYANVAAANSQISLFAAGNANVIPNYAAGVGWSPVDSRQAVTGFGPAANIGIVDAQGNVIYSAQKPPFSGNSQVSDNSAIPPVDSRAVVPADSRANVPVNSRVAPPFGEFPEP